MVKKRSVAVVVILSIVTFGIYMLYWLYATTKELEELKAKDAPKPWWILMFFIPLVNIVFLIMFYWKYSKSIEQISKGKSNSTLLFVLFLLIGIVAMALSQIELNKRAK